jgi:hypothetical protein
MADEVFILSNVMSNHVECARVVLGSNIVRDQLNDKVRLEQISYEADGTLVIIPHAASVIGDNDRYPRCTRQSTGC